jgi:sulfoxide reductase heme-binding subunit YedZ
MRLSVTGLGLLPLLGLILAFATDRLAADPVEDISQSTGKWALRLLLLTLAITPLRRAAGLAWLGAHRRALGLLTFLYASLHFATYLLLDLELQLDDLAEDILERPFIGLGFGALLLLTPLAITSTRRWMRGLAGHWRTLHRLVYIAASLAALHFILSAKADRTEPSIYAALLVALLGLRLIRRLRTLPAKLPQEPGRARATKLD